MRRLLTKTLADILRERLCVKDGYRFEGSVLDSGESLFSVAREEDYLFAPELASVRIRLDLDADLDTVVTQLLADLRYNPRPEWSWCDFEG